ncbi:MAG: RsmB/NOP family class I SAM-dependent RNA methyltransferase [Hyphomicrobiaceae bacterium]
MRPAARIAAAIEVLDDVLSRQRPTSEALSDWGKAHRIAGSGDRSAIGSLVYDALRQRASLAWKMESDTPRALALAAAGGAFDLTPEAVAWMCNGGEFAPTALTDGERAGLERDLDGAPPHIQADVPEWVWPSFTQNFGDRAVAEGQALARRAPTDIRVNTLKATREKVMTSLASFGVVPTPYTATGLRIAAPAGTERIPNLQAEAAFQAGWFEVQDEGSQVAAMLAAPGFRSQVLDLCAGAGGKSLAMAAAMQNTGQIYAYDDDRMRLKPIFDRLKRAGARNVQTLKPRDTAALEALGPRFDMVLVDAPCTGTGVWRRRPDAKWRLRPMSLATRQKEQQEVLARAARLVKPGGRLVYVTCSLLPEENTAQVAWLMTAMPEFTIEPTAAIWPASATAPVPRSADGATDTLLLTPASHGTDGFFIASLKRRAG